MLNLPDSSKHSEGDRCLSLLDELGELWCTENHAKLGATFFMAPLTYQGIQSNLLPYMERKNLSLGHLNVF